MRLPLHYRWEMLSIRWGSYYWNATRGAMVMQAQGRGTTRRTGQSFPVNSTYQNGQWNVIFELPDLSAGTTASA